MSTRYTPETEPETGPEPAPEIAPEPARDPANDAPRHSMVARLPAPAFLIGYGALLIAVVVAVAMFASYESNERVSAQTAVTTTQQDPKQPWNPALRDEDNVRASIRSYLITDVQTGVTDTGVMLRGTTTKTAEANLAEFTGHLSRLMQQNCLDTVVLTTPDNFRIEILGFCFDAPDLDALTTFTQYALDEGADSISFVDHYGETGKEISLNWMDLASDRKLEELEEQWDEMERPESFNRLRFSAFTPDEGYLREDAKGDGIIVRRGPRFVGPEETSPRTTTPQPTQYTLSPAPTTTSTAATRTASPTQGQELPRGSRS